VATQWSFNIHVCIVYSAISLFVLLHPEFWKIKSVSRDPTPPDPVLR